eukprot:TRINITY_DN49301_c0_g1_i1.p1 TRINITY_DN49301_c0_g1~~TRINITY_DN49301_c0_g1_i1.p1  ORF type:complete len:255 (-),score=29.51 TRINITY_DN49301_c0_g1_i1:169-933(-)
MRGSFGTPPASKPVDSNKYSHVTSSINTGASASRRPAPATTGATAKRRDEIFKRIKPATLVRMLQERDVCESVYAMGPNEDGGGSDAKSLVSLMASESNRPAASVAGAPATSVASHSSVPGSVLSVINSDTTVAQERDLVLLDLREPEEFEACHLPLAESYPATKINRDQFSDDLHRCKRDPTKLLVVYSTNDQTTAIAAAALVGKGWESVYCLSGGFEEMAQSYPEVLEGTVPERPETGGTNRTRSSSTSRRR